MSNIINNKDLNITGVDFSEIIFVGRGLLALFETCLKELGEGGI